MAEMINYVLEFFNVPALGMSLIALWDMNLVEAFQYLNEKMTVGNLVMAVFIFRRIHRILFGFRRRMVSVTECLKKYPFKWPNNLLKTSDTFGIKNVETKKVISLDETIKDGGRFENQRNRHSA